MTLTTEHRVSASQGLVSEWCSGLFVSTIAKLFVRVGRAKVFQRVIALELVQDTLLGEEGREAQVPGQQAAPAQIPPFHELKQSLGNTRTFGDMQRAWPMSSHPDDFLPDPMHWPMRQSSPQLRLRCFYRASAGKGQEEYLPSLSAPDNTTNKNCTDS